MGHRLTRIVTRTGDDGTTGLGDGSRVSKNDARVHALGEVDELNAHIGLLLCEPLPPGVQPLLVGIQHQLFDVGAELATPGYTVLTEQAVGVLDEAIAHYNAELPALREFLLPAGTRAAAQAHVCRTVARRAERVLVALVTVVERESPSPPSLSSLPGLQRLQRYLNRLSDLLFVLARVCNLHETGCEAVWRGTAGETSAFAGMTD
ncbi:cob(I)yrinic acid a,c-diamide adenosyltransferase [Candidatus Symbiobacter mobilis]|uniref:Cobalamin adenosyltransferase n=1 Tax=Candidatus Symbiobacter mobilis CR TaxID=946483 RepID=U5NAL6_9BURK|nr:cob(I)yrinic acid a,c-diamide adenosyltransferase [Candidatus Symbiobacter mobilis]AGX88432.1 cob(I)alamin adenosyltransferase [Candidatus Symbiobacter mobilis CR]